MNSNASLKHSFSFEFSLFSLLVISPILCLFRDFAYFLSVQASCPQLGNSPFGLLLLFSLHKVIKLNSLLSFQLCPSGGAALLADECSLHYFVSPSGRICNPSLYIKKGSRFIATPLIPIYKLIFSCKPCPGSECNSGRTRA